MAPLITIIGITGVQGGSVADALLAQGTYKIRGVTRNPDSPASQALKAKGVELVTADINDQDSLIRAFAGSDAIYASTDFFEPFAASGPKHAAAVEEAQGINLARAALATPTLKHYIWSTLPDGSRASGGKYKVPHFEAKNRIDDFIKSQPELYSKTSFLWISFYASNIFFPMFTPNLWKSSGKYVWAQPCAPDTPFTVVGDARRNVGIFVRETLAKPQLTLGKFVFAEVETVTAEQFIKIWGEATGKETAFVQTVSLNEYDNVWPMWGREMGEMVQLWGEIRDKSWSGESPIITKKELEIEQDELVDLREAFKRIDHSSIF